MNSRPILSSRLLSSTRASRSATLENMLGNDEVPPVGVKNISSQGIELIDGLLLQSPCIFLEGRVFLWDVPPVKQHGSWDGFHSDHFKIFDIVVPKPEILLLGTGETAMMPPPALKKYLSDAGIQIDVMNTWNACTTYNLLTEEGRRVAAALLPPVHKYWNRAGS